MRHTVIQAPVRTVIQWAPQGHAIFAVSPAPLTTGNPAGEIDLVTFHQSVRGTSIHSRLCFQFSLEWPFSNSVAIHCYHHWWGLASHTQGKWQDGNRTCRSGVLQEWTSFWGHWEDTGMEHSIARGVWIRATDWKPKWLDTLLQAIPHTFLLVQCRLDGSWKCKIRPKEVDSGCLKIWVQDPCFCSWIQ